MELEKIRQYINKKTGALEDLPFGPDALVFKVLKKMFALVAWGETPLRITLKCDPHRAEMLRIQYKAVQPGYYMNKQHWNTITLDGSIDESEILSWIDHSYDLVVSKLTKKEKEQLNQL